MILFLSIFHFNLSTVFSCACNEKGAKSRSATTILIKNVLVLTDLFSNHSLHSDEDLEKIFMRIIRTNKNVDLDRGGGKFSMWLKATVKLYSLLQKMK